MSSIENKIEKIGAKDVSLNVGREEIEKLIRRKSGYTGDVNFIDDLTLNNNDVQFVKITDYFDEEKLKSSYCYVLQNSDESQIQIKIFFKGKGENGEFFTKNDFCCVKKKENIGLCLERFLKFLLSDPASQI